MKQRPVKTEYNFSKQRARRQRRREEAETRETGVKNPFGLRQRIAVAPTTDAVYERLATGVNFSHASAQTRRQWTATAKRRVEQLAN